MSKNKDVNQEYWEKNIEGFSGFYDTKSEETINAPPGLSMLYKKIIFPIEKKYMADRYNFVCDYIDRHVKKGMKVADIGCGSGVFTKRMAAKGAKVYALDYAKSAVELTKRNLTPEESKSIEVMQLDITQEAIPAVDAAISIGVLTYIDQAADFFKNSLPYTNLFLFNYLDKNNLLNRIRSILPMLDVRDYSYHTSGKIAEILEKNAFKINRRQPLATGFIIDSEKLI